MYYKLFRKKIVTLLLMLSCKEHQDVDFYNMKIDET